MFHGKKTSKASNIRSGRKTKKRQFRGNRYTSENETEFASTSAKKLQASSDHDVLVDVLQSYCIISFLSIFPKLTEILECKICKKEVRFSKTGEMGLGFKLVVECSCKTESIESCPLVNNRSFEINRRIVFVLRILGIGLSGLNIFCGLMDLCNGFTTRMYYTAMDNIYTAAQAVHDLSIKNAAKEEIEKNTKAGNEPLHLTVSGDGTWSKRDFSSLFGVITLIGKYTNKVLDVVVKSGFCKECSLRKHDDSAEHLLWQEEHEKNCTTNNSGRVGKMEVEGIIEMFQRSQDLHGVMYKNDIGDGNSNLGGHTQNNNENYNGVLWHFAPKHVFSGAKIISGAVFLATCTFNDGFKSLLKIMNILGIRIGIIAKLCADEKDGQRVRQANRRTSDSSKEARTARRLEKLTENDFFEEAEGLLYGPGIAE